MDRIKKLKIKKQDGTFSDYIPIGADAENIDTTDGESVEIKLNKKPYYYDTVADMKADTKLKAGDMAVTKGYYSANDGGAGEYEIVNDGTLTDNGGSVHTLNNNLKAVLICDNGITLKQFGAYGDGTHDDTLALTNAINFLKNKFINNNSCEQLSLILNARTYLVSSTIQLPVYIKLVVNDNVIIKSSVSTGATLWINSGDFTLTGNTTDTIGFNLNKDIIGGTGSLSIERNNLWNDVNNSSSTSIGVLIGDSSFNSNYMKVARFVIKHLNVTGFNVGIKLNEQNTYLLTFDNVRLELNRYNFIFGTSGITYNNSGENISFYKCTFATSYNAFINNTPNGDGSINFNECSFDFNGNVLLLNNGLHAVFNSCHFEGIGYTGNPNLLTNSSNTTGFGSLVYNNFTATSHVHNSIIEINSPNLYLATSNITKLFRSTDSTSVYPLIVKFDSKQELTYKSYNFENVLINDENSIVNDYNCRLRNSVTPSIVYDKNDTIGTLSGIPNDTTLSSLSNYDLNIINADGVTVDTSTKLFNKSLKVALTSRDTLSIERNIYNFNKDRIFTTMFYKLDVIGVSDTFSKVQPVIEFYYYNKEGTEIAPKIRIAHVQNLHIYHNSNNDWYVLRPVVANVPIDCYKIKVKYMLYLRNSSNKNIFCTGNIYVDGLLIN